MGCFRYFYLIVIPKVLCDAISMADIVISGWYHLDTQYRQSSVMPFQIVISGWCHLNKKTLHSAVSSLKIALLVKNFEKWPTYFLSQKLTGCARFWAAADSTIFKIFFLKSIHFLKVAKRVFVSNQILFFFSSFFRWHTFVKLFFHCSRWTL